jgi:hypothetical protein
VEKVSEFLLPDGQGWDELKLNEVLFESDVDDILRIPVGRAGTEDYLAWNHTKNGIFNVKSAYHLCSQLCREGSDRPGSSSNCEKHKGWLALWAADVPNKVKVHCWRLLKNGLGVGDELQRRKIKEGIVCVACHYRESVVHRFWDCPHAAQGWEILRQRTGYEFSHPRADIRNYRDLLDWGLDWIGKVCDKERALGMFMWAQLWYARNEARETTCIDNPDSVVRRVMFLAEEWAVTKSVAGPKAARQRVTWSPPAAGWLKANVDGAKPIGAQAGGGGVVIRDHHGGFVAGAGHFFPLASDAEHVELLACRRAALLGIEVGARKLELETDSLGTVAKLNNAILDRSIYGPLVEEIKALL